MKILSLLIFSLIAVTTNAQNYYHFPDTGWSQTQLFGIHNGLGWDQYPEEFSYIKDSIVGSKTYKVITNDIHFHFIRQDNGKIFYVR